MNLLSNALVCDGRTTTAALAGLTGTDPAALARLVRTYRADFEEFGPVRFEYRDGEEDFLLNEDQGHLLLSYLDNTATAHAAKIALVRAFRLARDTARGGGRLESALAEMRKLADKMDALVVECKNPLGRGD